VLPFLAAALASSIKDAGLVISAQKTNDVGWKRPDTRSVSGGIVAGGIGNIASGLLGGVGVGISAGGVGLAAATGATARFVGLVTAALFLALAFMPKVTAAVALMPSPVMGAGLLYVACHLVTSGAELIASRMLDARRTYVIGLSLLAGVGVVAMPELFQTTPEWSRSFLGSPLAISTLLAVGLNLVLSVGISSRAQVAIGIDGRVYDSISSFFERQGAAWGARGDVIRRAAPAVTEWCEEIAQTEGVSDVAVDLQFDEYRLAATVRATQRRRLEAAADDRALPLDRIASHLARRYDCKVRSVNGCDVVFDFEH
jgi:NCS2 family nucleobase:cation symporter-2